jgi:hypothetical protein
MSQAKAITNKIVTDNYLRKTIFHYILTALILLSLAYLYLIVSIIFNVSARKTLENTAVEMSSKIGSLEVSYLTLSNSINQNLAASLGFVDTHNNIIVTRNVDRVAIR